LNGIGIQQAKLTGELLRTSTEVFDTLDLIVISPFTRTIQTALNVVGPAEIGKYPVVISPRCAEHTLAISMLQQGDRGSTAEQLRERFPQKDYPYFNNFADVDAYCATANGMDGGKWWHHSAVNDAESRQQFKDRAAGFRSWLGNELYQRQQKGVVGDKFTVMVFSHGGLLSEAFGEPKYENCEVRVFDIYRDGAFTRISTGEHRVAPSASQAGALSAIEENSPILLSVDQIVRDGQNYTLDGTIDQCSIDGLPWSFKFRAVVPWSKIEKLHADIRSTLTSPQYGKYLGSGSFPGLTTLWILDKLTSWFRKLSVAMTDQAFPRPCEELIARFFAPFLTQVIVQNIQESE
jgi:broad specificity phosphatase PhoE